MDKNSFKFQMQVTGRERKEVAGLIASHFKHRQFTRARGVLSI